MKAKAASNWQTKWSFVSLPTLRKQGGNSLVRMVVGLSSLGCKEESIRLLSIEFLNTMCSLTVAIPQRKSRSKPWRCLFWDESRFLSPYISSMLCKALTSLHVSHDLDSQSTHYWDFIQKSTRHHLRVAFPTVLLDNTIHSVCDVLSLSQGSLPPTGTFWSLLLFCLYPAKHSAVWYKKT